MEHSIIAPSSAHVWGKPGGCLAYPMIAAAYPETEEKESTKEGTAAHELAEKMLRSAATANINFPLAANVVGQFAENGVVFSEAIYDGAKMYAEDVSEVMRETGVFGGDNLGIETKINCPTIHELSEGTCDCFLFSKNSAELYLWDFKFGYLIVEAFENWQLINYAAGLLEKLAIDGWADQHVTVHFRIVQPRAFHSDGPVRTWSVKASDLRGYFNQLHLNAHKALSSNNPARSGNHCVYCPGRFNCAAALKARYLLYEAVTSELPYNLTPEALSLLYATVKRAKKHLEALETSYEEQIKSLIRSGKLIPGYRVEPAKGREKWVKPFKDVVRMGGLFGFDLRKEECITPKQARKLGIDGNVISAYSETPSNGYAVVPDDGKKAKEIFNK